MSNVGLLRGLPNAPKPSLPVHVCSQFLGFAFLVAHIVIGSLYLNECPRQHYIPIYLIVGGVFGLVIWSLGVWFGPRIQRDEDDSDTDNSPPSGLCTTWNSLTKLFLSCWFIAGSVWIYSIYQPDYIKNPASPELYCNKTLYLYAFCFTTVGYVLMGLSLVLCSCLWLCFCLCRPAVSDDNV